MASGVILNNASGGAAYLALTEVVTVGSTTSIFFNAESTQSGGQVASASLVSGLTKLSGVTAVRIA